MPRFNGTGPSGYGPGSGQGLGPCGGGAAYGRRGDGRGQGFGWRRFGGYYSNSVPSKKEEDRNAFRRNRDFRRRIKSS